MRSSILLKEHLNRCASIVNHAHARTSEGGGGGGGRKEGDGEGGKGMWGESRN